MQVEQKGAAAGYGISVSDLQRFAELPPHEVFAPKTGFFVSAAQLAQLLQSSLTSGVTGSQSELDARREALGSNKLPEREQVWMHNGDVILERLRRGVGHSNGCFHQPCPTQKAAHAQNL